MTDLKSLNPAMMLSRMIRMYHNQTNHLFEEAGMNRGQPQVLILLYNHENLNQKQMANLLGLSPATITVTLKRMESMGLVVREMDKLDQRVMRVRLSDKGRKMCAQSKKCIQDSVDSMMEGFSEQEVEQFVAFLARAERNLSISNGAGRSSNLLPLQ